MIVVLSCNFNAYSNISGSMPLQQESKPFPFDLPTNTDKNRSIVIRGGTLFPGVYSEEHVYLTKTLQALELETIPAILQDSLGNRIVVLKSDHVIVFSPEEIVTPVITHDDEVFAVDAANCTVERITILQTGKYVFYIFTYMYLTYSTYQGIVY